MDDETRAGFDRMDRHFGRIQREQTVELTNRMKNVEVGIGDLNARVDTLAGEVRQRFRYRGA